MTGRVTSGFQGALTAATVNLLLLLGATPAAADDGCAQALSATTGIARAMVAAQCGESSATSSTTSASSASAHAQTAVQGCATGFAAVQGTAGAPYVQAACNDLASRLGQPAPAAPPSDNACAQAIAAVRGTVAEPYVTTACDQARLNSASSTRDSAVTGCAFAHVMTADTRGQQWVDAFCPGATDAARAASPDSAALVAVGCAQAIQAVLATRAADPFVRAACAQAIASASSTQSGTSSTAERTTGSDAESGDAADGESPE